MNSYDNCMNAGSTNRKRVNPLGKPRGGCDCEFVALSLLTI
jgi:hypothetical protein